MNVEFKNPKKFMSEHDGLFSIDTSIMKLCRIARMSDTWVRHMLACIFKNFSRVGVSILV